MSVHSLPEVDMAIAGDEHRLELTIFHGDEIGTPDTRVRMAGRFFDVTLKASAFDL